MIASHERFRGGGGCRGSSGDSNNEGGLTRLSPPSEMLVDTITVSPNSSFT